MKKELNLFKSQDSKYYLRTAFMLTGAPLICIFMLAYSLYIFLELNYSFFISNGFIRDEAFKTAFFDSIFSGLLQDLPYLFIFVVSVFLMGLLVSYFILRPFSQIKNHANNLQRKPELQFNIESLSKKKLLVQSASFLFDYLTILRASGVDHEIELPKDWNSIKKPRRDMVFYLQYFLFITLLVVVSSWGLCILGFQLHEQIVQVAIANLKVSNQVTSFMQAQEFVLYVIIIATVVVNILLLTFLAEKIVIQVEGVSYAFFRDIRDVLRGNRKKRLYPRFQDPGQDCAVAINDLIDHVFYDELNLPEEPKPKVKTTNNDLPPVFVGEYPLSSKKYELITADGHKLENLSQEDVVKFLREIEK